MQTYRSCHNNPNKRSLIPHQLWLLREQTLKAGNFFSKKVNTRVLRHSLLHHTQKQPHGSPCSLSGYNTQPDYSPLHLQCLNQTPGESKLQRNKLQWLITIHLKCREHHFLISLLGLADTSYKLKFCHSTWRFYPMNKVTILCFNLKYFPTMHNIFPE